MKSLDKKTGVNFVLAIVFAMMIFSSYSYAGGVIPGITGTVNGSDTTFNLTAKSDYIVTPDGGSYLMWGYSDNDGLTTMQYPGPTLIVDQGQTVIINLDNELTVSTSMVFPGQSDVTSTGGDISTLLTRQINPSGTTVTYSFVATEPGTYLYNSGTRMELQIEMGLVGTIIIRPNGFDQDTNRIAYEHADSAYDHEYLFLHTEMDPQVHILVEQGKINEIDNTTYYPVYWFLNGRNFPDTLLVAANSELLPTQPYSCLPMMHPGDRVLMRMVGAGRDAHPFHPHSNNFSSIARDGRLLQSAPGLGADLAFSDYNLNIAPGTTRDAIFEWTGKELGFDIYGHAPGDPCQPNEYGPDHGKPLPVTLPGQKDLNFGLLYSGSPFLGSSGDTPPGTRVGGQVLGGAYTQIWHSHHEKEVCNNDIFPGGQITFMLIMHPDVSIP
jgi:FtsP/CotA-like multicopper oxidase with cupredoxin domain